MKTTRLKRFCDSRAIKKLVGATRRFGGYLKIVLFVYSPSLPILNPYNGLAEQFEVHGTITHSIFTKGKNFVAPGVPPNFTNSYSISVSDDKYKISVKSPKGHTYESSCDSFLYRFIGIKGATGITYGAVIDLSTIPPDDGTTINYIWLAYASAPYFSMLNTNRLIPIWLLDDPDLVNQNYTVPGIWKTYGKRLQLPQSILYLSDGIHRVRREGNKTMDFRYSRPFSNGFTNAEFRTVSTTNIGGLELPTRFVFERFYIDGEQRYTRTVTEGIANVVRVGSAISDFRPQFTGSVLTIDKRFSKEEKPVAILRYFVTNGIWPDKAALKQLYAAKLINDIEARKAIGFLKIRESRYKGGLRLVLLLCLLGPLLFLLANKLRTKKPQY